MPGKPDAEHVPNLALVPIRRGPQIGDGVQGKRALFKSRLDPDKFVSFE